jgi:hypothetical protein
METLLEIDILLTDFSKKVYDTSKTLQFSIICEFNMTPESLEIIPWDLLSYSGIYFIEIKNDKIHTSFETWISYFKSEWENEIYKGKFVSNPKKNRINKHIELKEWVPLYIGKSKNIKKRIQEHIYLPLEKPTFALKLNSREHLRQSTFRISTINIPVKNYNWIMPVSESSLRDKLNPIIGRQ